MEFCLMVAYDSYALQNTVEEKYNMSSYCSCGVLLKYPEDAAFQFYSKQQHHVLLR